MEKTIVIDPKKIAIPVGMVIVVIVAIFGWYKAYSDANTANSLAIELIKQENSRQANDIQNHEIDIKGLEVRIDGIETVQNALQKEIADRLARIETALGIKKN